MLSYLSKIVCYAGITILNVGANIYLIIILTGVIYFISVLLFIYCFPGLVGTSKKEISQLFGIFSNMESTIICLVALLTSPPALKTSNETFSAGASITI